MTERWNGAWLASRVAPKRGDASYPDLELEQARLLLVASLSPVGLDKKGVLMIAHTSLPVGDYQKSKAFYIKALEPLGYKNNMEYGEAAGFNDGKNTDFWISKEKVVVPTHLAFEARSKSHVEAFYEAALAAGGKDNGEPGYRDYSPGYYAAFIHDPDGNNIEAVWYDPSKEK